MINFTQKLKIQSNFFVYNNHNSIIHYEQIQILNSLNSETNLLWNFQPVVERRRSWRPFSPSSSSSNWRLWPSYLFLSVVSPSWPSRLSSSPRSPSSSVPFSLSKSSLETRVPRASTTRTRPPMTIIMTIINHGEGHTPLNPPNINKKNRRNMDHKFLNSNFLCKIKKKAKKKLSLAKCAWKTIISSKIRAKMGVYCYFDRGIWTG